MWDECWTAESDGRRGWRRPQPQPPTFPDQLRCGGLHLTALRRCHIVLVLALVCCHVSLLLLQLRRPGLYLGWVCLIRNLGFHQYFSDVQLLVMKTRGKVLGLTNYTAQSKVNPSSTPGVLQKNTLLFRNRLNLFDKLWIIVKSSLATYISYCGHVFLNSAFSRITRTEYVHSYKRNCGFYQCVDPYSGGRTWELQNVWFRDNSS